MTLGQMQLGGERVETLYLYTISELEDSVLCILNNKFFYRIVEFRADGIFEP